MIYALIGENISGKTKYVRSLYNKYGAEHCLYNKKTDPTVEATSYNAEALSTLQRIMLADQIMPSSVISIVGSPFTPSSGFLNLMSLVCKKRDYLLLDEPDTILSFNETQWLYDYLSAASDLYKEVWLVTHDRETMGITDVRFCIILDSTNLIEIEEDEANGILT